MPQRQFGIVFRKIRALLGAQNREGLADAPLLERFVADRDQAAFEALIERYGTLVHGVCRRVLGNEADAEDAFQATFLVLARKASSIRKSGSIGSWLYGVAYRVACDSRAKAARRRRHEKPSTDLDRTSSDESPMRDPPHGLHEPVEPRPDPAAVAAWQEIRQALDDELQRIPARYRQPLVLCYLQGLTHEETARELGFPLGSTSKLLARGRALLHARLVRRGVTLSAAVFATLLEQRGTEAAAPPALMKSTAAAAVAYADGKALTTPPAALANGVLQTMTLSKWKIAALVAIIIGLAGALGAWSALRDRPVSTPSPQPLAAASEAEDGNDAPDPVPEKKSDPLEEFRQALQTPVRDPLNADEIAFRKATLQRRAEALQEVGDLARALALEEWRQQENQPEVAAIDGPVRVTLVGRFERGMRAILEKGTPEQKLGALALLGQLGVQVRGETNEVILAQKLVADLIPLAQSTEPVVRRAAVQALGLVNPEPRAAVAVLDKQLASEDVETRRAAAAALRSLLQNVLEALRGPRGGPRGPRGPGPGPEAALPEQRAAEAVAAVVPAAGRGLKDSDPQVRESCLGAVQLGATIVAFSAPDPPPNLFPPPGRKPSKQELVEIKEYRKQILAEREVSLPPARALNEQVPALVRALGEQPLAVSLAAGQALEEVVVARAALARRAASVPTDGGEADKKLAADPLESTPKIAVPALARQLSQREVQVKLAAIYVLETLGAEASPAADALLSALADSNEFVRWGAARAVGKIAPARSGKAVPVLAKLLGDDSADVRVTAAAALERYGSAAKAAVPALGKAAEHSDRATRVWAIQALGAVGPDAKEAVPVLIRLLASAEEQTRSAAAKALGRLGKTALPALDALKKALNDPDADVRRSAAEALLLIR